MPGNPFGTKKLKKAVITVPAYFDDNKGLQQRCRNHCRIRCCKTCKRTTAASLAYGIDKQEDEY